MRKLIDKLFETNRTGTLINIIRNSIHKLSIDDFQYVLQEAMRLNNIAVFDYMLYHFIKRNHISIDRIIKSERLNEKLEDMFCYNIMFKYVFTTLNTLPNFANTMYAVHPYGEALYNSSYTLRYILSYVIQKQYPLIACVYKYQECFMDCMCSQQRTSHRLKIILNQDALNMDIHINPYIYKQSLKNDIYRAIGYVF